MSKTLFRFDTADQFHDFAYCNEVMSKYGTHFRVEASGVGWRNGYGSTSCTLEKDNTRDFLRCALGYDLGTELRADFKDVNGTLKALVYTHDSPTGELREFIPGWYCQGCGEVFPEDENKAILDNDTFCSRCAFDLEYREIKAEIAAHLWRLYEIQMGGLKRKRENWPRNTILKVVGPNTSLYSLVRTGLEYEHPYLTADQVMEAFNAGIEEFWLDRPREFLPIREFAYVIGPDHSVFITATTLEVNGLTYYLQ